MNNGIYQRNNIDYKSLILGILFIVTSLVAFKNPADSLVFVTIFFSIFAIIKGIMKLFLTNKTADLTGYKPYFLTFEGIIDIIVGVYLLFNLNIGLAVLPYVFAFWFLIDSVVILMTSELAQKVSREYFWFTLITGILGILIGISLLFNPISSALTVSFLVGLYFMIFGINYVVYAFR